MADDPRQIRRSPRYPFVDLGKAIAKASELWASIEAGDASAINAWKTWGYGPKSSGAIQTEAAMKQFNLLEVLGRGTRRRLKISHLGKRIVAHPDLSADERRNLLEQAALAPEIHRELWSRWRDSLPPEQARTYLIQHRGFQEKGADALIAEYQKTMSFLEVVMSNPIVHKAGKQPHQNIGAPSPKQVVSRAEDFVDLRFEGDRLILSASIDRQGIPNLLETLRANQRFVGRITQVPTIGALRPKRRK